MQYFQKVYPARVIDNIRNHLTKQNIHMDYRWFIVDPRPSYNFFRQHLNEVLEVPSRHGVLKGQLLNRLRSRDEHTFFQALQELRFAHFVEKDLKGKIEFFPPGKDKRILDLKILIPNKESILVEVKSYFHPLKGVRFGVFSDKRYIRNNLKSAIQQLPENSKNLVVLAGEASSPSPFWGEMMEVLYDRQKGLLGQRRNAIISVVGAFNAGTNGYQLTVYHNAFAGNPIDEKIFGLQPQFIRCRGSWKWINNPETRHLRIISD